MSAALTLTLQVGTTATAQDQIKLEFADATTKGLGADGIELDTAANALTAIGTVGDALKNIRSQREKIGQAQVAMEYNINNRQSMKEQLQATVSNIGEVIFENLLYKMDFIEKLCHYFLNAVIMNRVYNFQQTASGQTINVKSLMSKLNRY